MAKEETILIDGKVTELLSNAKFRILLDSNQKIIGHISGKIRQNDIKILLGDTVTVELSPYDLSKGRIIRRR